MFVETTWVRFHRRMNNHFTEKKHFKKLTAFQVLNTNSAAHVYTQGQMKTFSGKARKIAVKCFAFPTLTLKNRLTFNT